MTSFESGRGKNRDGFEVVDLGEKRVGSEREREDKEGERKRDKEED